MRIKSTVSMCSVPLWFVMLCHKAILSGCFLSLRMPYLSAVLLIVELASVCSLSKDDLMDCILRKVLLKNQTVVEVFNK